jgi:hypothetical protein
MEALLILILVPVLAWFILSPIVVAYWWFNPQSREGFMRSHETIGAFIALSFYAGTFLLCAIALSGGLERLFAVFIPDSWGISDEDGEFVPIKVWLAIRVGGLMTIGLAFVYWKLERLRDENAEMRRELAARRDEDCDETTRIMTIPEDTADDLSNLQAVQSGANEREADKYPWP